MIRTRIVPESPEDCKAQMNAERPRSPPVATPVDSPDPEAIAEVMLDSRTLFTGGRNEVAIRHNGRTYRLRCTRLGKLILTA
jgi:hemin uptake protein HemP